MSEQPRVSIGMPAYNSEATIAESLECLLAQTYTDFELVVSDNASSDGTEEIVREYARRDRRIRPIRQNKNIGANGNYSEVVRQARGTYFKWASSNDWCDPRFLELCVAVLDQRADVVIAAPRTRIFESDPSVAVDYQYDIDLQGEDPVDRLRQVIMKWQLNNIINGLIRMSALQQTRLIEHYPGADVVLMGHLALLGKIALLPEPLFYRRMDQATATFLMGEDAVKRHHYPEATFRSLFPAWRRQAAWLKAAFSAPLSVADRARAMHILLRHGYWDKHNLLQDIGVAAGFRVKRGEKDRGPSARDSN